MTDENDMCRSSHKKENRRKLLHVMIIRIINKYWIYIDAAIVRKDERKGYALIDCTATELSFVQIIS